MFFKCITLRMESQSNISWKAEEDCFQAGEGTTGQEDWQLEQDLPALTTGWKQKRETSKAHLSLWKLNRWCLILEQCRKGLVEQNTLLATNSDVEPFRPVAFQQAVAPSAGGACSATTRTVLPESCPLRQFSRNFNCMEYAMQSSYQKIDTSSVLDIK